MDEQTVPPASTPEPVVVSSLSSRIVNSFTSPSELYTEVASAPVQTSSWLVPLIISVLLAVMAVVLIYNNSMLRQQVIEMQLEGMKKSVTEGKMTQEQFDRTAEMMESGGGTLFMILGGAGAGLSMIAMCFGGSLVLWLVIRLILKSTGTYKKVLEIFGLSWFIGILGSIVTLITMNYFGSLYAIPAASVFFSSLEPTGHTFRFLSSLNIFTIWEVVVLGIGLAKISGKPNGTGIVVAIICWLVFTLALMLLGLGV